MASQIYFTSIEHPQFADSGEIFVFPAQFDEIEVAELPLKVRTRHVLLRAGIRKLSQLRSMSVKKLLKFSNCGQKTIADIRVTVASLASGKYGHISVAANEIKTAGCSLDDQGIVHIKDRNLYFDEVRIADYAKDWELALFPISERVRGALQKRGVALLKDMDGLYLSDFAKQGNIGRKSVQELARLVHRINQGEYGASLTTGSDPHMFAELVDTQMRNSAPRVRVAVERRLGAYGDVFTLETTGRKLRVTRERVRQICIKFTAKLSRAYGPKLPQIRATLTSISKMRETPIDWSDVALPSKEYQYKPLFYMRVLKDLFPELRIAGITTLTARRIAETFGVVLRQLPETLTLDESEVHFTSQTYPSGGSLVLKTSDEPLRGNSRAPLNVIDFIGEVGVIASYPVGKLGSLRAAGMAEFIYGECVCPILEDPNDDCVRNDRQRLIEDNVKTQAILEWVRTEVEKFAQSMDDHAASERKRRDLRNTSEFNRLLNNWKNRFLQKLMVEMLAGRGPAGISGTNPGGGGRSRGGKGENTANSQKGNRSGTEGGDLHKRNPRFPTVLVSGQDRDPLDSGASVAFECDPRHPAIYQRVQDVAAGIYWINTSRPLSEKILQRYSADHPRWREYVFQRYVDIILREALYLLGREELTLTPDDISRKIDDVTTKLHDQAALDLDGFLFDDRFNV